MQFRLLLISFILCWAKGYAQQTPLEIKHQAWNIHALRVYPFNQPADSFMMQVIEKNHISNLEIPIYYEKMAIDLVMNKQYLTDRINRTAAKQNFIYKKIMMPYSAWLAYARPSREDSPDLNLTVYLQERQNSVNQMQFFAQSPLEWIGMENIRYCLQECLGGVDIWKEKSNVLFSTVKSPLAKSAINMYKYFFSSITSIDSVPAYEIAFFSQKFVEEAFEGYLYISVNDLRPIKAVFTLNPFLKITPAKVALFVQTPSKKESLFTVGDEITAGLLVEHVRMQGNSPPDSIPDRLTPAQKEISGLVEEARNTRAYSNTQHALSFLLTEKIGIFNDNFNLGPITQMISYNYMEGLRLRTGGITSQKFSKHAAVGGYLAYGLADKQWKYRGDISYYPRMTDQIGFTYVNDLNIPGYDCMEDIRDRFYYSLYRYNTTNMSFQKIGRLMYETDGFHRYSLNLHAKYLYERPIGSVNYETLENGVNKTVQDITTAELGATIRFAPNERHVRIMGKRVVFHTPDLVFGLSHRMGFKGIFNSDYNYHITTASVFKSLDFPANKGSFDMKFSGGKVWNRAPFPLLFIPKANQSYIFSENDYNLMRFYEFITDRYVAGNAALRLNWSPVKLFLPKSALKTHYGIKALYGPLSDNNNPQLHPELFLFNNGVESLGDKPFSEANIGISGIFNLIRIDYVYRLTYRNDYRNKGSLYISASLSL